MATHTHSFTHAHRAERQLMRLDYGFAEARVTGWIPVLLALLTFVALNRTKVNPIWFILGSGVVGVFALR